MQPMHRVEVCGILFTADEMSNGVHFDNSKDLAVWFYGQEAGTELCDGP